MFEPVAILLPLRQRPEALIARPRSETLRPGLVRHPHDDHTSDDARDRKGNKPRRLIHLRNHPFGNPMSPWLFLCAREVATPCAIKRRAHLSVDR